MQLLCEVRSELRARLELRLEQRLEEPHSALANPDLTIDADKMATPDDPSELLHSNKSCEDLLFDVEHYLLQRWSFRPIWQQFLDSPLIVHADAARQLSHQYDCALAVSSAGIPYGKIFQMTKSMPVFTVDFSHHKRKMTDVAPLELDVREYLRECQNVLLIDVDCCSGKTIRTIHEYLKNDGITNTGAYLGLNRWPGIGSDGLGCESVDFDSFWTRSQTGLVELDSNIPFEMKVLPKGFELYAPNQKAAVTPWLAMRIAKRVGVAIRGY